jgi:hypothetical protein
MSDSFMSSMTFSSAAQGGGAGCDCDECGIAVPGPILKAMREHKRQKLETGPLKRTQERILVCRQDGLTVWKWTMPLDAEPLIEFGSTHRLIWLEKLPGRLQSIGTGIIGSSDEEKTRNVLDWEEGDIYLVPSNGGKAVGWIHSAESKAESSVADKVESEPQPQPQTVPTLRGHAILQTVKIPIGAIATANPVTQEGWVFILLQICQNILEKNKDNDKPFYPFPDDCNTIVRRALQEAQDKSASQAPKAQIPTRAYHAASIPEPIMFKPLIDASTNDNAADNDEKKRKAKDDA